MDAIWNFLGVVIVALFGLVGVIVQAHTGSKLKKQNEISKEIHDSVEKLREESKADDLKLHKKLDNNEMNSLKRYLVTEMTKIKDGTYIPTEEQKRILKEAKDQYNDRGGDSYVDDMYDDLRDSNLI